MTARTRSLYRLYGYYSPVYHSFSSSSGLIKRTMCSCGNRVCDENCPCFTMNQSGGGYKKAAIIAGTTIGVGVASFFALPLVVTGIGFTAGGVAASSTAASMMSSLGTSGLIVPVLQSIGATGSISVATAAAAGASGGVVAAAVDAVKSGIKNHLKMTNFCSASCKCGCQKSKL